MRAVAEVVYPSREEEPMAESDPHFLTVVAMIAILRHYFRHRRDWYIIGNLFWYYEEGNPNARRAPDLMVVKGVDPTPGRQNFRSWVEGAIPSFIAEVLSFGTMEEDLDEKRTLYERLGVKEFFLIDPTRLKFASGVMGYRLVDGSYVALEANETGLVLSEELGLLIGVENGEIVFESATTGERLMDLDTTADLLEEAKLEQERLRTAATDEAIERRRVELERDQERRRAEAERARAEEQRARAEAERARAEEQRARAEEASILAEAERTRAEEAERRTAEQAAEIERLRRLLDSGDAKS